MKKAVFYLIFMVFIASFSFSSGQGPAAKPDVLSFTLFQPIFGGDTEGTAAQELWEKQAGEHAGVEFDITYLHSAWGEYLEKIGPYIAAQDFSDMFLVTKGKDVIDDLGDSGLIVNVMDYEESVPNYMKFIEGGTYNRQKVSTPAGAIYGFFDSAWTTRNLQGAVHVYRFDTFKKHNLKYPTTPEEFYQTAKRLKELYPNSSPIGSQHQLGGNFITKFLSFNHTHQSIYWNGEEYKFGPVDDADRFKQVLTYFNKLYSEGLLDPEVFTLTLEQFIERCLNGKYHMLLNLYEPWINEKLTNANFPNVEWGATKGLTTFNGELAQSGGHRPEFLMNTWAATVINAKTEYPELLAKVLDFTYTEKAVTTARFGIPDVTYYVDKNGMPRPMPEYLALNMDERPKWLEDRGFVDRVGIQFQLWWWHWAEEFYEVPLPWYVNGKYITEKSPTVNRMRPESEDKLIWHPNTSPPPIQLNQDERDMKSTNMTAIDTFVSESLVKFIIGDMDVSKYDEFIKDISKYGDYKKVVDMQNRLAAQFK